MRNILFCLLALIMALPLQKAQADSSAQEPQILELADSLAEDDGFLQRQIAFELYKQVPRLHPESYQAHWKAARAYYVAGTVAERSRPEGWEDLCADYGEKGMEHAQKAIELNPQRVEGNFYYGLCAGVYSEGISLVAAALQGLRKKAREHLEKAYELNKTYMNGVPALALGRYWEILPAVAGRDLQKALEYYQEADRIMPQDSEHRPELNFYMGALLLKLDRQEKKARELLQQAALSEHPYFSRQARDVLQEEG
ncbi:MAG: hypothetical protein ACLFMQ_00460 [Desulfohalobiaceae bacterium]